MREDDDGFGAELPPSRVFWEWAGAGGDYPGLRSFFGAYLHMFWLDEAEDKDWRTIVRVFKTEDPEAVPEVVEDADALLGARLSEDELERVLMELGLWSEPRRGPW
jgi:hypothetical protein